MIVVKVGGAEGIDYGAVAKDAAALWKEGVRLLLVHGGSALTNRVAEALGHPPRFLTHSGGQVSRLTDKETLDIFLMVYCGLTNKRLVELLQKEGVNALGLSGVDGRLLEGRRKTAVKYVEDGKVKIHRGDYTGTVERVNRALLDLLLEAGYLPVITPPAISYEGEAINTDGDQVAALLATAYGAEALVYLSNVPGLLANYPDEASLVREIPVEKVEAPEYLALAQGRMKRKVMGAVEAVRGGVKRVVFADARVENPIRRALAGEGTVVR
ncbi:[LysW]-aminoadipate kinase [Thermus caliditerrae]|uniref:[LysW]-aminoadipate kinase n=1 Tax=Thermus caliditerrae TaxID=1330700 RepID=UPI001F277658|nr:[LysW]-aminoadipate kinase [Thermus caliditerrae]